LLKVVSSIPLLHLDLAEWRKALKLSILKEHCKSIGRDYDSILKTKLGRVVIEGDRELARKRSQRIVNMPEEQVKKED